MHHSGFRAQQFRAARFCATVAALIPAPLAGVAAQSGPAATAIPKEYIVGEWVGRCEAYGSTPAADCAKIGPVIPQQLEEMARIKAWMDPLRAWPEEALLKRDERTSKFLVQYVDYGRSTAGGGVMTETMGSYSKDYGNFRFTERETREAHTAPHPFTPGVAPPEDGTPGMLSATSILSWRKLVQFSAHEMFHAYQASSPFRVSLYPSVRSETDFSVAWIGEGSAEAIGYLYQQHRFGAMHEQRDTSYARPLNRTDDKGYDRGEFWLRLAEIRGGKSPAQFLFDLHKSSKFIGHNGYDESIAWLDGQLRARGSRLREDYGRVIARVEEQTRYFPDGYTKFAFPQVDANSPEQAVEVRSESMSIPELAATGFIAMLYGKDLEPAEDKNLPGRKLVWFELQLDAGSSPERVGLAVADQWRDQNPFTRLILPQGLDIEFFGRLTNVDGEAPATTEAASASVHLITRAVHLRGPGCTMVGKSYEIGVDYQNNPLGSPPKLEFKSQRGGFSQGKYIAPRTPGPDKLLVHAWADSRDQWVPFADLMVKARCNIVIIGPDGGRMTYDDDAKATRVERPDGEPPSYIDAGGMVGLDPETKRWVRVPLSAVGGSAGGAAFYAGDITKDGLKLNALYQGPLLMVELYKLMRRDIMQKKKGRETSVPCPGSSGTCRRFVADVEPGSAIYFDKVGEPVAIEADGEMTRIEYSGDAVVVPPA